MKKTLFILLFQVLLVSFCQAAYAGNKCLSAQAARDIEEYLAGGLSLQEALKAAFEDGYFNGTKECWAKVKGYASSYRYTLPNINRLR